MPTGWRSSRLATWSAVDRSRTAPVDTRAHPADSYAAYALNARVMLIRKIPEEFGTAGQASKIVPLPMTAMAKRYASGELAPKIGITRHAAE